MAFHVLCEDMASKILFRTGGTKFTRNYTVDAAGALTRLLCCSVLD